MKRAQVFVVLGAAFFAAPPGHSQNATPARLRELSASYESLAERVRPAVVQIFSTGYAPAEEESDSTQTTGLLTRQTSTGSGVILSPDGYIVTNNHVVQGARKIEVKLAQRDPAHSQEMTLPAKLVGADRESDVAVIKIERAGLPTLSLGDSNQLKQGQIVMAFGNPLGLEGSVSMGIVSSTSRRIKADDPRSFIQTDAPINPGNSGGPLVDLDGRVVGINTLSAGLTGSGVQAQGIGFAIAIDTAKQVANQLIASGHVSYAYLGVQTTANTPALAQRYGLPNVSGVAVVDVTRGSPAQQAGLRSRDVITAVGDHPTRDDSAIFRALQSYRPGDRVVLQWTQAGSGQQISKGLTLGEAPPAA